MSSSESGAGAPITLKALVCAVIFSLITAGVAPWWWPEVRPLIFQTDIPNGIVEQDADRYQKAQNDVPASSLQTASEERGEHGTAKFLGGLFITWLFAIACLVIYAFWSYVVATMVIFLTVLWSLFVVKTVATISGKHLATDQKLTFAVLLACLIVFSASQIARFVEYNWSVLWLIDSDLLSKTISIVGLFLAATSVIFLVAHYGFHAI